MVKTCEEYVLQQLEAKDKQLADLNMSYQVCNKLLQDSQKREENYKALLDLLDVTIDDCPTDSEGRVKVTTSSVYPWDSSRYEKVMTLIKELGLEDSLLTEELKKTRRESAQ